MERPVKRRCYARVPLCLQRLATYSIFNSKNFGPLGEFKCFSTELIFTLFDAMDILTLGKVCIISKTFFSLVTAYFETKPGKRRLEISHLHLKISSPAEFVVVRDVALYYKRATCLLSTRRRLAVLVDLLKRLSCHCFLNVVCAEEDCQATGLMGELLHTFVRGWDEMEIQGVYDRLSRHFGLDNSLRLLLEGEPGANPQLELQFRTFITNVFLRGKGRVQTSMSDRALWFSLLLSHLPRKNQAYVLYLAFGPLRSSRGGQTHVLWSVLGEATPESAEEARQWFRPLATAFNLLLKSNQWSRRQALTLLHEVTILHGETWLLENAACLLVCTGEELIEELLVSRVNSRKTADVGAWVAALCVALVHLGLTEIPGSSNVCTILLKVIQRFRCGPDVCLPLFASINNTFKEFIVEYAELMSENPERINELNKILSGQDSFYKDFMKEVLHRGFPKFSSRLRLSIE